MELADFIQFGNETPVLRFLIIGGWADAARGYPRVTFDVEVLLRRHDINLADPHYKTLFLKYGNQTSMTPSSEFSVIRDALRPSLDFDLPDSGGFTCLPTQVPLERMILGIRQMRAWFPGGIPSAEDRWRGKTDKEFHL